MQRGRTRTQLCVCACCCCSCCSCCCELFVSCELYVSVSSDESDKSDDDGDDDSENGCVAFSSSDETVRVCCNCCSCCCNCCSCCCNCCSCCCSCCCRSATTFAKYVSGRRRCRPQNHKIRQNPSCTLMWVCLEQQSAN